MHQRLNSAHSRKEEREWKKKLYSYFDCRISWWWCPGKCSAEPHGPSGPASSQQWPLDFERLCRTFKDITRRTAHCAPCMETQHWQVSGGNPGSQSFPKLLWQTERRGILLRPLEKVRRGKQAHCTHGGSEPFPVFQSPGWEERRCLFLFPQGGGRPVRWYFLLVSQSGEQSRLLILHYSPLLWGGPGELSDERRWSHSWGAELRVFLFYYFFYYYLFLIPPLLSSSQYLCVYKRRQRTQE